MQGIMKKITILKNRLLNRVYYCKALSGQSAYNICINSDMTVSCNCQDYDGRAHIGDLRLNTFEEMFSSGKAQEFREILAQGKFPVPTCKGCHELMTTSKTEVSNYTKDFSLPKSGIMVENTILCNLSCRFCDRKKTQSIRKRKQMSLDDVRLVAKIIKEHQIEAISYFNLGEPFLNDTFKDEISILKSINPNLRIYLSTNGVFIDTDEKMEAALRLDYICFSISGPSQTIATKYQVGGDFDKSFDNMKHLVAERNRRGQTAPIVEWKYVVFNWNDSEEHINKAIDLARAAGVNLISFLRGGGAGEYRSRRYKRSRFFKSLGNPSWRGREIWFNKEKEEAKN